MKPNRRQRPRSTQLLDRWQIWNQFIRPTLLAYDYPGFWFLRWPESRWTPTMVAEALEKANLCKITKRYTDGLVAEIWMNKEVSTEEVERLCLGDRREYIKKKFSP